MRIIISILLVLLSFSTAFADKLIVPFYVNVDNFQDEMLKKGYILDGQADKKTPASWGFVVNEGQQIIIYTYRPASEKELTDIVNIATNLGGKE